MVVGGGVVARSQGAYLSLVRGLVEGLDNAFKQGHVKRLRKVEEAVHGVAHRLTADGARDVEEVRTPHSEQAHRETQVGISK